MRGDPHRKPRSSGRRQLRRAPEGREAGGGRSSRTGAPAGHPRRADAAPGGPEEERSARPSRSWSLIVALDNLQSSGLAILSPNIQASLHVSSGVIVFVTGISGGFLVLGIVPLGWLADRLRRGPIVGFATSFFGLMVFASGVATNIFLFFCARFGAGISQASTQTVHRRSTGRHLSDQPARAVSAPAMGIGTGIAGAISPVLVGAIATVDRRARTGGAGHSASLSHPDRRRRCHRLRI